MPRLNLIEAAVGTRATPVEGRPGRFLIELITPGWGTSAYYSPEVLQEAARDRIFGAGTHMYLDHPRGDGSGVDKHGNRSVESLAAVLGEDATWNGTALVAEARVFGDYREKLTERWEDIGTSIRAYGQASIGTVDGRRGQILERFEGAQSVDFVSHSGRGGRILQVIESGLALQEARNIGQWIESRIHRDFTVVADDMAGEGRLTREERIGLSSAIGDALGAFVTSLEANQPQLYTRDLWADPEAGVTVESVAARRAVLRGVAEATANETRERLSEVLRETYGGEKSWVWVRDFDDTTVWYEHETSDEVGVFALSYAVADDGAVSISGDPAEVRVETNYVPVNPAGQQETTEESEEDTMPQIEEARLRELEEAHGRVPTLESELATERQRAETAESGRSTAEAERDQERARNSAAAHARTRVTESNAALAPATVDRIVADATATVPLTEAGALDTATLDTAVDEARTAEESYLAGLAEAAGTGRPRGFGKPKPADATEVVESDVDAMIARRAGTEKKGA